MKDWLYILLWSAVWLIVSMGAIHLIFTYFVRGY